MNAKIQQGKKQAVNKKSVSTNSWLISVDEFDALSAVRGAEWVRFGKISGQCARGASFYPG